MSENIIIDNADKLKSEFTRILEDRKIDVVEEKSGLYRKTIRFFCKGRNMGYKSLFKLASALGYKLELRLMPAPIGSNEEFPF